MPRWANRAPDHLPPEVRDHPEVIKACRAWDLGRLFRLMQNLTEEPTKYTASHIARRCEMTQSRVAAYMDKTTTVQQVRVVQRVVDGLRIPGARFGLPPRPWERTVIQQRPRAVERDRADDTVTVLMSTPANGISEVTALDQHAAAVAGFRLADRQVGGGQLYGSVLEYLREKIAPNLFGATTTDGVTVFSAAAGLTEMAGWMAHDSGNDHRAATHFERALVFSQAAGFPEHDAHIFASMSHLARERNDPQHAVELARNGLHQARTGSVDGPLVAKLYSMQARALAVLGQKDSVERALTRAYDDLGGSPPTAAAVWMSPFDEASLAIETAQCLRDVGRLDESLSAAERAVALRDTNRARSLAFSQIVLASVLVELDDLDRAVAVGRELLGGAQAPGSARVVRQLGHLRAVMEPHRAAGVVCEFLEQLTETQRLRGHLLAGLGMGEAREDG
jgi:tetratricopeptide (TPR) repeat protein